MTSSQTKRSLKQGVSIGAASEITNVEVHTLRHWEREFAGILNPLRTTGGQRRYRPEDIQVVMTLSRLLRDEMFSVAGAKRYLLRQQDAA